MTEIRHPAVLAGEHGHKIMVVESPPQQMGPGKRWVCADCGASVFRYNGNLFGSAIEQECKDVQARKAETEEDSYGNHL